MIQYSIKDLEQLTGIKAHTIRIWEKRYQLIEPERTSTNIRFYSDNDLKKLLNVSTLNRNGLKISSIVTMNNDEINERIMEISDTSHDSDNQIEQMIVAMIDLDEQRFERVLSTSVIKIGFDETVIKVLYPFFEKIGLLWQIGTIYPAQEHFVSNLIRQKLIIAIDGQSGNSKPASKTFLIFLPSNEWHELGLLFYSYLVKKAGFRVIYLGQSVPFEDLIEVSLKHRIDYLFTSVTTPLTLKKYSEYIHQLSLAFPDRSIFVSGYQTHEFKIDLPINVRLALNPTDFIDEIRTM
ncbi:MAG: MerR family transcriptional regulator [Bacteroidales bacterium]|nr:MerR family transcriptional regulator [Bacteroidales bacterium]